MPNLILGTVANEAAKMRYRGFNITLPALTPYTGPALRAPALRRRSKRKSRRQTWRLAVIYGMVGLVGKDFDIPVAVLSTFALGLAIYFAEHFVVRFQQYYATHSERDDSQVWTAASSGNGILRNAVLVALGFAAMGFAHLTPYIAVGVRMAAIMLLSSISTIAFLPALICIFDMRLPKGMTLCVTVESTAAQFPSSACWRPWS